MTDELRKEIHDFCRTFLRLWLWCCAPVAAWFWYFAGWPYGVVMAALGAVVLFVLWRYDHET